MGGVAGVYKENVVFRKNPTVKARMKVLQAASHAVTPSTPRQSLSAEEKSGFDSPEAAMRSKTNRESTLKLTYLFRIVGIIFWVWGKTVWSLERKQKR